MVTHSAKAHEPIPLTAAGRRQLQDEIGRVEAHMVELRALVADAHEDRTADEDERAAAFGMLDDLGRSEARLAALRAILERAVDVVSGSEIVGVGTTVRVQEDDGAEATYTVVSPAEASAGSGRVSVQSPIGRALEGHRAGDEVTVDAPAGSWALRILAIEDGSKLLAA